jgi:aminoglycoside 6'-N-acetyltransferase
MAHDLPHLSGAHVHLRPAVPADLHRLREILAEPAVRRWWNPAGPDAAATAWLDDDATWTFAIEVGGRVVGSIQCHEEPDPDYRSAGIDLFLSADAQGRGLGPDAIRTLARWLIHERGHHRLTIDPAAANHRAIRAYAKVGFRPVGRLRDHERGPDGTWHDGLLMDLLAGELT